MSGIKWAILLLLLCPIPLVNAAFCEDLLTPGEACNMTTPSLTCSVYNYSVIAEGGAIIKQDNLTLMNLSIYRAEFNLSTEGSYIWKLCDASTREIYVRGEENMAWLAIVCALAFMSAISLVGAISIKERGLASIKGFLFMIAIVNGLMLGTLPLVISWNPGNVGAFNPIAIGYFSVNGLLIMAFIWMYGLYLVQRWRLDKQEER